MGSPTKKGRKDKPRVIPYCRFTKIIICHLGRIHNIHQRSASSFHLVKEDFRLGNLKFVPKGEIDEVFEMPILDELISNNIRNAPYYIAYLEMVTKASKERPSKASADKPPKPKPAKEKSTKTTLPQPTSKAIREPVTEATRLLPMVKGKGKAIATEEQVAYSLLALHTPKRRSIMDQFVLQRRTPVTEEASTGPCAQAHDDTSVNIIRDSPSPANVETGTASEKTDTGAASEKTDNQGEAGSDPGKTNESQPPPEQEVMDEDQTVPNPRESCEALAGLDTESTHNKFMADLYPKVQESLKFSADEHVMLEEPLSPSWTLSSMKNLDNPGSKVFTLELRDIPHKIDEAVHESMKEAVYIALQALLRDRFRELPEANIKEILHQRMFKSGSYKSLPEHVALCKALEASIERAQRDEFLAEKDKPEWLKPLPDNERPATPEPAWVIPSSHIPDVVNNWANALATTYQAPAENSLLEMTGDMRTFMHWYCQQMGKTEITQADFEGQTYKVVKGDQVRINVIKPLPLSGPLVVFPVGNNERKIMRFNEIYKFSDGTLTNIMEALDFRVKGYKVNRLNSGMNMRFGLTRMWQGAMNLYMPLNEDSRPEGSSKTWNALLVVAYEILTTNCFREPNEHFISAFRSIVIQRLVKDLQLGVESYQKMLNLTKTDTYHSDLKRKEAYIAYSNPRGFIYQNKDKQNRLMRIDELHKFSDGTLTDVRTALDNRLKGIQMKYLPQSIWRKSDKDRAAAII
nr:hypothetical protein [Tanacetum cinerariifolium]